jgi:hypothetical protein
MRCEGKPPAPPTFVPAARRNVAPPTVANWPRTSAVFPVRKLVLFALLNTADLGLTWYLLRAGGGTVYESNPVAAWWLGRYGWVGLAGFKAAMMAVTAGLGVFIFFRRPRTGHRVLTFGCAALAAVVLYSGYLCHDLRRQPGDLDPSEATRFQGNLERMDADLRRAQAYRDVLTEVIADVRGGRCALSEGVARLAATEQANDATWMTRLRFYYPGRGDRECLAITLVNHIDQEQDGSTAGTKLRRNLETQFLAQYGRPLPTRSNAGLARRTPSPV